MLLTDGTWYGTGSSESLRMCNIILQWASHIRIRFPFVKYVRDYFEVLLGFLPMIFQLADQIFD
jgi:hypothetical protein